MFVPLHFSENMTMRERQGAKQGINVKAELATVHSFVITAVLCVKLLDYGYMLAIV